MHSAWCLLIRQSDDYSVWANVFLGYRVYHGNKRLLDLLISRAAAFIVKRQINIEPRWLRELIYKLDNTRPAKTAKQIFKVKPAAK